MELVRDCIHERIVKFATFVPVSFPVMTRNVYEAVHKRRTGFTILQTQVVNFEKAVVCTMGVAFD